MIDDQALFGDPVWKEFSNVCTQFNNLLADSRSSNEDLQGALNNIGKVYIKALRYTKDKDSDSRELYNRALNNISDDIIYKAKQRKLSISTEFIRDINRGCTQMADESNLGVQIMLVNELQHTSKMYKELRKTLYSLDSKTESINGTPIWIYGQLLSQLSFDLKTLYLILTSEGVEVSKSEVFGLEV